MLYIWETSDWTQVDMAEPTHDKYNFSLLLIDIDIEYSFRADV